MSTLQRTLLTSGQERDPDLTPLLVPAPDLALPLLQPPLSPSTLLLEHIPGCIGIYFRFCQLYQLFFGILKYNILSYKLDIIFELAISIERFSIISNWAVKSSENVKSLHTINPNC